MAERTKHEILLVFSKENGTPCFERMCETTENFHWRPPAGFYIFFHNVATLRLRPYTYVIFNIAFPFANVYGSDPFGLFFLRVVRLR